MPTTVTQLAAYSDQAGNVIEYDGDAVEGNVRIKFEGSGNRLTIASPARLGRLWVDFNCDNGRVHIGATSGVPAFSGAIRVGQDASVRIGRNVSCTSTVTISAVEGTTITIGDDVMFASENELRGDDGHPIFDVRTGLRVNPARSIRIGSHVWVGRRAVLLGGAEVGNGAVIGYGSVVTRRIPNNCVAVGVPAKVVRRDTAWERPHLSLTKPYYKPDASTVPRSRYWNLTESEEVVPLPRRVKVRARKAARSLVRRAKTAVRGA